MHYKELKEKLQKALSILENKRWASREELEGTAINTIKDFFKEENLPMFTADERRISFVLTDYPMEPKGLFTYGYEFKSDKRKPDGLSDYLLSVNLEPMVDAKFCDMDILELFEYMNHYAAVLHNQRTLIEEKNLLFKKIGKIEEELKMIEEVLKKYV